MNASGREERKQRNLACGGVRLSGGCAKRAGPRVHCAVGEWRACGAVRRCEDARNPSSNRPGGRSWWFERTRDFQLTSPPPGQSQLKAVTRGPKSTRAWLSAALPRERPTALEGMPAMPPTSAAHTQPCMHAPTSAAHNHTLTFSLSLLYLILSLVSLTSGKTNYTTIVGVVVEGGQLVVRLLQPPRGGASGSCEMVTVFVSIPP